MNLGQERNVQSRTQIIELRGKWEEDYQYLRGTSFFILIYTSKVGHLMGQSGNIGHFGF